MPPAVLAEPKVIRQFGSIWGPWNCGFATAASLVYAASGGKIIRTAQEMRKRTHLFEEGASLERRRQLGPSNLPEQIEAITDPRTAGEFTALGLQLPKMRYLRTTDPATVTTYLAKGATVSVCIAYHVFRNRVPESVGSHTFGNTIGADGHSIRLQGLFHEDGTPIGPDETPTAPRYTDVMDPMCDGRELDDGTHAAKGPQRLPLSVVFKACAAVPVKSNGFQPLGKNKVLALVVKAAKPIDGGLPINMEPVHDSLPVLSPDVQRLQMELNNALSHISSFGDIRAAAAVGHKLVQKLRALAPEDEDDPINIPGGVPLDPSAFEPAAGVEGAGAGEQPDPPADDDDKVVDQQAAANPNAAGPDDEGAA